MHQSNNFEICVRALIKIDGKILFCQVKGKGHYFFPGGHVEFDETADGALARELDEELGVAIKKAEYIGTVENIYQDDESDHHEINLVFKVELEFFNHKSKEEHISFALFDRQTFQETRVLPIPLKNAILQWLDDGKQFFVTQV